MNSNERERRRQRRYREAMRNRAIAAVVLVALIVGAVFIVKGCKKDETLPADDQQGQQTDTPEENTQKPPANVDDELLTVVNPWNPLPEDWVCDLVTLSDGRRVDSRCYEAFEEMMAACRDAGYAPFLCSAYRTQETQQSLYDNKVQRLMNSGMGEEEAKVEAAKAVAIPGTSEHQLGLAVDIVDESYQLLDEAQEQTPVQQWLMAHCQEYGFILRYPTDKSDITGIGYEPWHYRYVGREAAAEIMSRGICLEEYLGET